MDDATKLKRHMEDRLENYPDLETMKKELYERLAMEAKGILETTRMFDPNFSTNESLVIYPTDRAIMLTELRNYETVLKQLIFIHWHEGDWQNKETNENIDWAVVKRQDTGF